jgi:hypothetical protein
MSDPWEQFSYAHTRLQGAADYALQVVTLKLHGAAGTSVYETQMHKHLAEAANHLGFDLVPRPAKTAEAA